MTERLCNWCAQPFTSPKTTRIYCSVDCSNEARWTPVERNDASWCTEWSDAVPSRYGPVCIPCKLDSGHDGLHSFEAAFASEPHSFLAVP